MSAAPTSNELVQLIDAVYAVPMRRSSVQDVVDLISSHLPEGRLSLYGVDEAMDGPVAADCQGWPREAVDAYMRYFYKLDPWLQADIDERPGHVISLCEAGIDLRRDHAEFYHDFLKPHDIGDGVSACIVKDDDRHYVLSFDYAETRSEAVATRAAALLQSVAPSLRSALALCGELETLSRGSKAFEADLERSQDACFIVGSRGELLWMNAIAEHLLARGVFVRTGAGGRLRLVPKAADDALTASLASLERPPTFGASPVAEFALGPERARASSPKISVTPLSGAYFSENAGLGSLLSPRRRALVRLIAPRIDALEPPSLEAIRKGLELTPAEARAARALAAGQSLNEISASFGLSIHTVRGQIKSALTKTGARRQAELVRRVIGLGA